MTFLKKEKNKRSFTLLNNFAKGKIAVKHHLIGFTLIELLVVIAIMAILVAVAVPQVTGMISQARNAAVKSALLSIQSESAVLHLAGRGLDRFHENRVVRDTASAIDNQLGRTNAMTLHHDNNRRFCAVVRLLDGRHWCVDNTGFSGEVTTPIDCKGTIGTVVGTFICRVPRVFVTSTTTTGRITHGTLVGLDAADAICQERANAAALGGTWRAWLSTGSGNTIDRFGTAATRHTSPIYNLGGLRVANNWNGVISGNLLNAINRTENREVVSGNVWTGTNADGTRHNTGVRWDSLCQGGTPHIWNSPNADNNAAVGHTDSTNAAWTNSTWHRCSRSNRIYCFEL